MWIGHAPSHRAVKGTNLIIDALNSLKKKGFSFELVLIEGLSNSEARKKYETVDVLVDQLFAGWYGGLAVEAMALGKPVLVMRDTTERPEGIATGTAKLVGTDSANITKNVTLLIENPQYYANMAKAINPYGNGKASKLIVDWLK